MQEVQKTFIDSIKKKIDLYKNIKKTLPPPIHYKPDKNSLALPDLNQYLCKDVIAFVPHLQFPQITIKCIVDCCAGVFQPDGWASGFGFVRSIYSENESIFFMSHNYKCGTCAIKKNSATLLQYSQDQFAEPLIPLYIQNLVGIHFTEKSGVSHSLRDFIVNSASTGMTFIEIMQTIKSAYLSRYLKLNLQYREIRQGHLAINRNSVMNHFPSAGAASAAAGADGCDGAGAGAAGAAAAAADIEADNYFPNFDAEYGENGGMLTSEYITEMFKSYMLPLLPILANIREQFNPHPVQSLDHTYTG